MNLTRGINLKKIAEAMPGASGAEIKVSVTFLFTKLFTIYQVIYYILFVCVI